MKNWGKKGQGVDFYPGLDLSVSVGTIHIFPAVASFTKSMDSQAQGHHYLCFLLSCGSALSSSQLSSAYVWTGHRKRGTADAKSIQLAIQSLLLITCTPGSCFGSGSHPSLK